MIKVEVLEKFSLKDFDKIQNIKRASVDEMGKLFIGDTFECDEEMAKYLLGENPLDRAVVKVIEVEPIEEATEPVEETIEEVIEPIEDEEVQEEISTEIVEEAIEEPKKEKKSNKKK